MATDNSKTPATKTPEQEIAELKAQLEAEKVAKAAAEEESSTFKTLLEEANKKAKASVEVPTVEIEGETYKINVPMVTHEGNIVKITELEEKDLKGFIGEALELVK